MKIIMIQQVSGAHGDDMWPIPGGELDCADAEARQLIAVGLAVKAPPARRQKEEPVEPVSKPDGPPKAQWPPKEERAVVEAESEARGSGDAGTPPRPVERRPPAPEQALQDVAPRRGPGRPRKDSLPK